MPDDADARSFEATLEDLVTRLDEAKQQSRAADALLGRIVEELKIAVARTEEFLRR